MSYILDALKKSERERPPGPVPDLFAVQGPQPSAPRRVPVRAVVTAALLLAVPAIALWVWLAEGPRSEDPPGPPLAAPRPIQAEAPGASVVPGAVVSQAAADAVRTDVPRLAARPRTAAPPAKQARRAEARRGAPAPSPAAPVSDPVPPATGGLAAAPAGPPVAPAPIPMQATEEIPSVPALPVQLPSEEMPASPPLPSSEQAPPAQAAPLEESPPADGRVLEFDDLPASVRAELPKLVVSGHVWSEEPSLRFLSVDDRLVREGGQVVPGVDLREITSTGAVFTFKGWRFKVAGTRP